MRKSEVILLVISVVCTRAYIPDPSCNCKPLEKCVQLTKYLQVVRIHSYPKFWYDTLAKMHCPFDEHVPQVCCPPNDDFIQPNVDGTRDNFLSANSDKSFMMKTSFLVAPKPLRDMKAKMRNRITDRASGSVPDINCGTHSIRDQNNDVAPSEFPWVALLEYNTRAGKEILCGGVLISDEFVLTAAHCVTSVAKNLSSVLLGKQQLMSDDTCILDKNSVASDKCTNAPIRVKISQKIVNDNYPGDLLPRGMMRNGDLALLKLETKVPLSDRIQPICLPIRRQLKNTFYVSGWSKSMIPGAKGLLQKMKSKVSELNWATCKDHPLLGVISDDKICVGANQPREMPCVADAGGPLMAYERRSDGIARMTLYGVSSLDLACGRRDIPGVYTRTYEYLPWIHQYVQGEQILG